MFGLCAIGPAVTVVISAARGITGRGAIDAAVESARAGALASSAIYAGAIALLAGALAWPAALLVARLRARWLLALATPMLLPAFLAYAAWSVVRAPTTPLGRLIGEAPEHGLAWAPLVVGRTMAVWGLALWAWPLAAVVMAIGLRALGPEIPEALRLERCGAWRRAMCLAGAARPSIVAALLVVALLMLGSAVPLHVARAETHAIRVWLVMDEHPAEPWLAWIAAWPLLALAAAFGWALSGPLARMGRGPAELASGERAYRRPSCLGIVAGLLPWTLSIVVPFGLFLWSVGSLRVIGRFLRDAREGIASGAAIGGAVGVVAASLALGASQSVAQARGDTRAIRPLLALALGWGLIPGVLVGSAVAQATRLGWAPEWLGASAFPVVVAHVARFAFLPVLVGTWLGVSEARAVRELRALDGATGLAGWARTAAGSHAGPVLGVALATACLSFHEIESSIQVQPPGLDHLAQRLLQWLHYERMAELSAAGVCLLGLGIAAAGTIALVTGLGRTRTGVHR